MSTPQQQLNNETATQNITETPSFFRVVMLNDDYTPMEFVVHILQTIFHKNESEAHNLMMLVHKTGKAIVGRYTFEIAETKVSQVHAKAKKFQFPLMCVVEKED